MPPQENGAAKEGGGTVNEEQDIVAIAMQNKATVYIERAFSAAERHTETINGLDFVTIEVNGKRYSISIAKSGDGIRIRTWDGDIGMYAATGNGITVMTFEERA